MRYRGLAIGLLVAPALAAFLQAATAIAEPADGGTFRVRYAFSLGGKLLSHAEVTCDRGKTCLLFTGQGGVELSLEPGTNGGLGTVAVGCGEAHCGFAYTAFWNPDDSRLSEFVVLESSPPDFGQELVMRIRRRLGGVLLKYSPTESPLVAQPAIEL